MQLNDMVAVVTGGASGIGKYISEELLLAGCRVAFTEPNQITADAFINEAHQHGFNQNKHIKHIKCDVTNGDDVIRMIDEAHKWHNQLDILVNNATLFSKDHALAGDVIRTKLMATVEATYKSMELMGRGGKGGHVINISSTAGLQLLKLSPTYTATESAVIAFTRTVAVSAEAVAAGVRINCLCPGTVSDEEVRGEWERRPSNQEYVKRSGCVSVGDVCRAFCDCLKAVHSGKVFSVTTGEDGNMEMKEVEVWERFNTSVED